MRTSTRPGFAFLWVIASVAVLAVLMAAAAPALQESAELRAVKRTSVILHLLSDGVDSFYVGVKTAPTKHALPHFLNQLTTTELASGDSGGCSNIDYNSAAVTAWDNTAPFTSIYVPVGGVWTPIGKVNDVPSASDTLEGDIRTTNRDEYYIQIPNVDYSLAQMLDMYVDGTIDGGADTVRYSAPDATGRTLVSYLATPTLPAC
jgi:Tfp pilus assembly protein PilE